MRQPTEVSSPASERTSSVPVLKSRNEPVPYVFFDEPGVHAP